MIRQTLPCTRWLRPSSGRDSPGPDVVDVFEGPADMTDRLGTLPAGAGSARIPVVAGEATEGGWFKLHPSALPRLTLAPGRGGGGGSMFGGGGGAVTEATLRHAGWVCALGDPGDGPFLEETAEPEATAGGEVKPTEEAEAPPPLPEALALAVAAGDAERCLSLSAGLPVDRRLLALRDYCRAHARGSSSGGGRGGGGGGGAPAALTVPYTPGRGAATTAEVLWALRGRESRTVLFAAPPASFSASSAAAAARASAGVPADREVAARLSWSLDPAPAAAPVRSVAVPGGSGSGSGAGAGTVTLRSRTSVSAASCSNGGIMFNVEARAASAVTLTSVTCGHSRAASVFEIWVLNGDCTDTANAPSPGGGGGGAFSFGARPAVPGLFNPAGTPPGWRCVHSGSTAGPGAAAGFVGSLFANERTYTLAPPVVVQPGRRCGVYLFANDSSGLRFETVPSGRRGTPTAEDAHLIIHTVSEKNERQGAPALWAASSILFASIEETSTGYASALTPVTRAPGVATELSVLAPT